ncbi:MAG: TIGR01777 family oxidoreductase [Terriglobia bacterium]|jgi:hypothetical protein
MHILVTGSSGLVGSALIPALAGEGHRVTRLVRSTPRAAGDSIPWDPAAGILDAPSLEGFDAVVHLAGESIAGGRWTVERKARIRDSRVNSTRLLSERLAQLTRPPKVLISASAVGYYGDRGDETLTEESPPGSNFLAGVCREWEAATEPALQHGIRVAVLRSGVVLSPAGGALAKMLFPFRMGVGGIVGSGKQYFSWISIDDLVRVIIRALKTDSLRGPVNAVAPHAVTNAEFTKALGQVLGRPTIVPMPAFAARIAFGEMADELLLASARVVPAKLLASGFVFHHAEIGHALTDLLQGAKAA